MTDKISSEDFIKAFGGGVKHKMINISKEEIRDKMFFIREEDSDQPIAVIRNMPSAKTYIRVKANGKVMIAPVIIGTMSMEMSIDTIDCSDIYSGVDYIRRPVYPTFNVDFQVVGDMIEIDSEGTD